MLAVVPWMLISTAKYPVRILLHHPAGPSLPLDRSVITDWRGESLPHQLAEGKKADQQPVFIRRPAALRHRIFGWIDVLAPG